MIILTMIRQWVELMLLTSQKVLPNLANEIAVTGAAGAWVKGSYAQVAADIGSSRILIKGVQVVSITGSHQIEIAYGAAASEVVLGSIQADAVGFYNFASPIVPINSRIAARTATKAGTSQACAIKLIYCEAP
jgi:hypothetical protein